MRRLLLLFMLGLALVLPLTAQAQEGTVADWPEFVTEDGYIAGRYPPDWSIEIIAGNLVLANDAGLLERYLEDGAKIQPGEVVLSILFYPMEYAHLSGFEGETLDDKIAYLSDLMEIPEYETDLTSEEWQQVKDGLETEYGIELPDDIDLETPEEDILYVNAGEIIERDTGFRAGRITLARADMESALILWDVADDLLGFATVVVSQGEMENFDATLYQIIESIEFRSTIESIMEEAESER